MKVESGHGPMQTFERQVASGLERCTVPERRANFAIDKNMPVACLAAEPSSKIDHRPNRAVVTAPLEADRPERRESVGDAYAEAERVAGGAPADSEYRQPYSHRRSHSRRPNARIRARYRIVEQNQYAVANEAFQRAFKLMDQRAERRVVFPQNGHHLFGLGGLRKCREVAQIAEDDRNFAAMAFQRLQSRRRQDEIGDLRRKKSLEAASALDLDNLLGDSPLERVVQFHKFNRLLHDAIVQFLDPQHRSDARN